ncbi:MAG: L,D-transpeptidase family protein [Deltaproteobacteria bacterium]
MPIRLMLAFILMVFSMIFSSSAPADTMQAKSSVPLQAVVVKTADWNTFRASLQRFERKAGDAPWNATGGEVSAVVGRNGLGWGRGIHPSLSCDGPVKREGDGKAPAGMFRLGSAFGYAPPREVSWIKLPYLHATARIQCVDDVTSPYYNTLVDTAGTEQNWHSYEDMRRQDDQYRLGTVVEHNADPAVAGRGSCIFLHIWKGPFVGTSGCTAMEAKHLEELLLWLNPYAMPVLVQMPESDYARFRSSWRLP